jgi:putative transposase
MNRKRRTPDQVVARLRDAEADVAVGLSMKKVCKKLGVSRQTWFRWSSRYGGSRATP